MIEGTTMSISWAWEVISVCICEWIISPVRLYTDPVMSSTWSCVSGKKNPVGDQLERVYLCVCVCDVNQAVMIWKSPTGKLLLCVEFSTGHSQNTLNVKISFQSLSFHCVWQAQKSPKKDFINSGVLFLWLVVVVVLWIDWSFIWYLQSPENANF